MAIELRTWHTSEGIDIPYYQLPYSEAEIEDGITDFLDLVHNQLYQYDNYNSGEYLADPFLTDMRWISSRVFKGWNARNAVSFEPAGAYDWLTTSGPQGPRQRHSPGTEDWEDLITWEGLSAPGSKTPSWMGRSHLQMRPYPNELFGWEGAGIGLLGTTAAVTSDYKLVRFDFSPNENSFGWQSWYVSRSSGIAGNFPADVKSMLSTLIESSDDEGEDVSRFNPRTATNTVGCYIVNKDGLREFVNALWTTDIIDSIRNAFIGDGSNALLGIRWFYGIKSALEPSDVSAHISLGNVSFTEVPAVPVAIKEFVEMDMGSVVVPQHFGDYRDWAITTYKVYLPFVGFVDLDPQDIVGKTLYLKYWINLTDGSALCNLSTTPTSPNGAGTLFATNCSWGYDIPIRVDSVMDALSRVAKVTMGSLPVIGETFGAAGQYSVGELSPNSNVMSDFQPKLVVFRKDDISGDAFKDAEGAPGAAATTVGACTGYVKATTVYNAGSLAMRRSGEIIALLKEGIYI